MITVDEYRTYPLQFLDIDEEDLPFRLIDRFVAEGFQRIIRAVRRWPFYEVTETVEVYSGVPTYSLSTVKEIRSMHGPRGELEWMDEPAARDAFWLFTSPVPNGWPRAWSEFGDGFRLWPTPDATYTITVLGYRDADTSWQGNPGLFPDVPEQFHEVLLNWVMYRAYLQQDDPTMAQIELQNFSSGLTEMVEEEMSSPMSTKNLVLGGGSPERLPLPKRLLFPWE